MDESIKQYVKFFVEKNSITDVDVFTEFSTITDKKSNLSKNKRDAVVALVAYSVEGKFSDFVNLMMIVLSFSKNIENFQIKKKESFESALKRFIEFNSDYIHVKHNYATISEFEQFVLKYEYRKLKDGICYIDTIVALKDKEIESLSKSVKKRVEQTLELIKENPEEFGDLVSKKLIY